MSYAGKNVGKKLMYGNFTLKMLTDRGLKNLKPKEKPYKKADGFGLYVRVLPNGSIYFQHRFRFHGKELIDQGFLSRVLLSAPKSRIGARTFRKLDDATNEQLISYQNKLKAILDQSYKASSTGVTKNKSLILTPEAEELYIEYINMISLPDIYQLSIHKLKTKSVAARIVNILLEHHWLEVIEPMVVKDKYRKEVFRIIRHKTRK